MKKIGNKGFSLVELLAIIVLLSIVMGIAGYSVIHIVKKSRDKDYQLLIENINNAVELYYQECKFVNNNCVSQLTLGELVNLGFLKGNETKSDNSYTIVNPYDNNNISHCIIKYSYVNGDIVVEAVTKSGSCPTSY